MTDVEVKLFTWDNVFQGLWKVRQGIAPHPKIVMGTYVYILREGTEDCYDQFFGPVLTERVDK